MQAVSTFAELDDHVVMQGATWADYERLVAMRGESNRPMLFFLDGEVEIVSPSIGHEYAKCLLARLLEAWADERNAVIEAYGEVLLKKQAAKAGAQPDECYIVRRTKWKGPPDLVIEIEWSRNVGIPKEQIYRRLGIRELWTFRRDGTFTLRVQKGGLWIEQRKSVVLPELDVWWLVGFTKHESQTAALRAMRRSLRRKR
jgi:Uma2 family endonuclease